MYTKPPVLPVWGETNKTEADMLQPSNAFIQTGWPESLTPPSRQKFNWFFNFIANAIRYLMQRGLPDWDTAEEYGIGSRVIGDDGLTYVSLQNTNVNHAPSAGVGWWAPWALTLAQVNSSQLTQADPPANDNTTKVASTRWVQTLLTSLASAITTALNAKQNNLGFSPVEQGNGVGQGANKVRIGWSGTRLKAQVDNSDLGNIVFDGDFSKATGTSGWMKMPNGMIMQWTVGASQGNVEATEVVNWPIEFPTACLHAQVTLKLASATGFCDATYHLVSVTTTGCTVQKQVVNNANPIAASTPYLFAIGY